MTRPYAVVDIDGVVADVRHRLHHLQRKPKDWDGFFAGMADDPLLDVGAQMVAALARDCDIVWLTGRPERYRRTTLDWLERHGLPAGRLLMRRGGDRRPARITKLELLRGLAAQRRVAVHVDDDPAVVAALRAAGFEVLYADWAGADEAEQAALFDAQERRGRS